MFSKNMRIYGFKLLGLAPNLEADEETPQVLKVLPSVMTDVFSSREECVKSVAECLVLILERISTQQDSPQIQSALEILSSQDEPSQIKLIREWEFLKQEIFSTTGALVEVNLFEKNI